MKAVIATAVGHDGIQIRQPGEKFGMPDGAKGSWFKDAPVAQPDAEDAEAEDEPKRRGRPSKS